MATKKTVRKFASARPRAGGYPMDKNYGKRDIVKSTLAKMRADCETFLKANYEDVNGEYSQAGHDYWLNRNGHGAGFWDGDWPEPAASRLDKASKAFGEFSLYVGDNGKIDGGQY